MGRVVEKIRNTEVLSKANAKLDVKGRVSLNAECLKEIGLAPGDSVVLTFVEKDNDRFIIVEKKGE